MSSSSEKPRKFFFIKIETAKKMTSNKIIKLKTQKKHLTGTTELKQPK